MFHQFLFILVITFIIFILVKTGFPKTGHIYYIVTVLIVEAQRAEEIDRIMSYL